MKYSILIMLGLLIGGCAQDDAVTVAVDAAAVDVVSETTLADAEKSTP
ncbi:MAG: hypothetical protein O3C15_08930 [Proteobacteria bacterium]|nr:hypothetical protein [Pseudomonadota bacterium]